MVRLRKLQEKDAWGMLEWMQDADIMKGFRFQGKNKTIEDICAFIRDAKREFDEKKSLHYAIVEEQDEYLGTISLKNIDYSSRNAEYAISLRKKSQGKGIAMCATHEILKKAFVELNLHRVYLNVFSDNLAAIRLYEKSGFVLEGQFREHISINNEFKSLKWYGILKDEWMDLSANTKLHRR
ncbi:MAG: GNAT family N-acetyltransferase [Lachnospiraceae bacterium]|nr:GNAT family N-acetyltransferase [Lachnospiraceae bacterium]